MKTSVIEVSDMLSVLTVDEVEKRKVHEVHEESSDADKTVSYSALRAPCFDPVRSVV